MTDRAAEFPRSADPAEPAGALPVGSSVGVGRDMRESASDVIGTIRDPVLEAFERARAGDRAGYGRFAELIQDRLYNAVARMTGDVHVAGDLVQETLARALEHLSTFKGASHPYTWVYRIAMNLVMSRRRSDQVRRAVSLEGDTKSTGRSGRSSGSGGEDQMSRLRERIASSEPGPADRTELAERLAVIGRALNEIDAEDRALLVMRDIDGMDYAEMAEVLEVPLGTLKSRLFRARVALRKRAEELGA